MTEDDEKRERIRRDAAARERADWAEMQHVYERCVAIAEKVWRAQIDTGTMGLGSRNRQQFITDAATTLMESADRRGLTARWEEPTNAPQEPKATQEPAVEAASGADEGEVDEKAPNRTPTAASMDA